MLQKELHVPTKGTFELIPENFSDNDFSDDISASALSGNTWVTAYGAENGVGAGA